jgi:hypothetical protein
MARQRYYGEKFKPTKGAFGGTSKFNRRLKLEAELKAQIAEMEEKKKQEEVEKSTKKKPATEKSAKKKDVVEDRTE